MVRAERSALALTLNMPLEQPYAGPRCAQCGRPALFAYPVAGPTAPHLNLCLDHGEQYEAINQRRVALLQGHLDHLDDHMHDIVGLPRPHRPPRSITQRVLVNQVHIHGNNTGVVNTGTVGSIEQNLTIANALDPILAGRLKELTEAILAADDLTKDDKKDAADLLVTITAEAAKPREKRAPTPVLKALAAGLDKVLLRVPALMAAWKVIEALMKVGG
jgi:hypothetical protein